MTLALVVDSPALVQALELQNRSVQLSDYEPSAVSNYSFQFFVPTINTIGSIVFQYCTNSALLDDVCNAPPGIDVTPAAITSQSGNTGFSVNGADSSSNRLVITRAPLAGSIIATTFAFSGITNPSVGATTIFVRISTHASTNGSGAVVDSGGVAYVTASPLNVAAYVPPYLKFCVGLSVATDCSSMSGDSIELGILSANQAGVGQSQFSTGTNDPSGYVIFALGTTMTSGNNIIPALASPTPSFPGNSQFGINLRANSNPASGQDPVGVGTGAPTANYGIQNQFEFNPGDVIAISSLPTDYNRMTVSYLVNIGHAQPLGVYSTTITYVATVQF